MKDIEDMTDDELLKLGYSQDQIDAFRLMDSMAKRGSVTA